MAVGAVGVSWIGRVGGGCVGSHLKSTKNACDVRTRESPGTTPNEYTQLGKSLLLFVQWPRSAENSIQGQEPSARFILLVELHTDFNCSFYSEVHISLQEVAWYRGEIHATSKRELCLAENIFHLATYTVVRKVLEGTSGREGEGWSEFRDTANTKFWSIDFPPLRNGVEIECSEMKEQGGGGERYGLWNAESVKWGETNDLLKNFKADFAQIALGENRIDTFRHKSSNKLSQL